ncbi:hypothetical protein P4S95_23450 [Aneurinibacillus aneurinilyticus]|uniref:hypothetical protein n=1 Tax=Aneurinibacillus aneurinilyticus TaxID=1391 RepID=UPI002E1D5C08|nr:hypothetical protein [Aneurinibacillus aneurinilyticus]
MEKEKLYLPMHLQFFADDEIEEDDDPNKLDDDVIDEDELEDEIDPEIDENTEDDVEDNPEEPEDEKEEEPEVVEFTPAQQRKIDQIVQQRLGRNNNEYARLVRELERSTGMDIHQVMDTLRQNKIEELIDSGMSEEDAKRMVDKDRQLAEMEEKQLAFEQQQREFIYSQQKAELIKNPHIKKYEAEIDAFSQHGNFTDFDTAARYVIGSKVLDGELLDGVRQGAEKRALAMSNKRQKVSAEKGRSSGGKADVTLSKQARVMAANFGLDPKEVAKAQERIAKERGKRK